MVARRKKEKGVLRKKSEPPENKEQALSSYSSFWKGKRKEREEKQGRNGIEKGPCSNEQGPIKDYIFSSSPSEGEEKDFCPG